MSDGKKLNIEVQPPCLKNANKNYAYCDDQVIGSVKCLGRRQHVVNFLPLLPLTYGQRAMLNGQQIQRRGCLMGWNRANPPPVFSMAACPGGSFRAVTLRKLPVTEPGSGVSFEHLKESVVECGRKITSAHF